MALALQWHGQSNRSDSVVQVTPRTNFDPADGEVVMVICDGKIGHDDDPRLASAAASVIYESFYRDTAAETTQRLGNALNRAIQLSRGNRLDIPGSDKRGGDLQIIAVALQQDKLTIARSKGGNVYLLRGGLLQNLTDDTFSDDADVDIGQLDLEGDDRVMLCSSAVVDRLNDLQIRNILRGTPATRKATQALLTAAGADTGTETQSVATLDYITGTASAERGAVEPGGAMREANPSQNRLSIPAIVALAALVIAGVILIPWLSGNNRQQQAIGAGTPGTGANTGVSSNASIAATSTPIIIIVVATPTALPDTPPSPTETALASQVQPSPAATTVAPTAELLPTLEPTVAPTDTVIVLPTLEPTETRPPPKPTRRPRTATPIPPTETPLPPPTAVPPTDTPVPPPPSNGGGGGGGGGQPQPPPVCPPGATCG